MTWSDRTLITNRNLHLCWSPLWALFGACSRGARKRGVRRRRGGGVRERAPDSHHHQRPWAASEKLRGRAGTGWLLFSEGPVPPPGGRRAPRSIIHVFPIHTWLYNIGGGSMCSVPPEDSRSLVAALPREPLRVCTHRRRNGSSLCVSWLAGSWERLCSPYPIQSRLPRNSTPQNTLVFRDQPELPPPHPTHAHTTPLFPTTGP